MSEVKFLQIHSLHSYAGVLLNRDDAGFAKKLPYGGVIRTRISSQCLKRHWRVNESIHSLSKIDGSEQHESVRSRAIVTKRILVPLFDLNLSEEILKEIEQTFQTAIYGDRGKKESGRQPLLLGKPEIEYLASEARKLAEQEPKDLKDLKVLTSEWKKKSKEKLGAMREGSEMPGGLTAALFGRMVTSDPKANIDAPIHVAHSLSVHGQESDVDFFSVVDDLKDIQNPFTDPNKKENITGADHLNETDINSGLFYGYVVIDRKTLLENLGASPHLANEVVSRLIHLIATVSPGAKQGSTAPYSYAGWIMVEAGNWQPRSLMESFRKPYMGGIDGAVGRLDRQILSLDRVYQTGEARQFISSHEGVTMQSAENVETIHRLAETAGHQIASGVIQ